MFKAILKTVIKTSLMGSNPLIGMVAMPLVDKLLASGGKVEDLEQIVPGGIQVFKEHIPNEEVLTLKLKFPEAAEDLDSLLSNAANELGVGVETLEAILDEDGDGIITQDELEEDSLSDFINTDDDPRHPREERLFKYLHERLGLSLNECEQIAEGEY